MRFTDYIKKMVTNYFIIFAIIVISMTILRQIFAPDKYMEVKDIYIYMICALVGDLPSLIFYSAREIPENAMRLRIIIHFVALEAAILVLANIMGWISGMPDSAMVAIQIALVYVIVRFLSWIDDRRAANSINEKLKAMKAETADGQEEKE